MNNEVEQAAMEAATETTPDVEAMLERLRQLAEIRRKKPEIEIEYAQLREALSTYLKLHGPTYFIGSDGEKHYAYNVTPEPLVINIEKLIALYKDGKITEATLDEMAPRKVSAEGVKRAANSNRLKQPDLIDIGSIEEGTSHVRFAEPDDRD